MNPPRILVTMKSAHTTATGSCNMAQALWKTCRAGCLSRFCWPRILFGRATEAQRNRLPRNVADGKENRNRQDSKTSIAPGVSNLHDVRTNRTARKVFSLARYFIFEPMFRRHTNRQRIKKGRSESGTSFGNSAYRGSHHGTGSVTNPAS